MAARAWKIHEWMSGQLHMPATLPYRESAYPNPRHRSGGLPRQAIRSQAMGTHDAVPVRLGRLGTVLAKRRHRSSILKAVHVATSRSAAGSHRARQLPAPGRPGPADPRRRKPHWACRSRHHARRCVAYRCAAVAAVAGAAHGRPSPGPGMRLGQTPLKKFTPRSTICRQTVVQMSKSSSRQVHAVACPSQAIPLPDPFGFDAQKRRADLR